MRILTQKFVQRWLFLILSSIIMVFFSEKMYWYVQGYVIIDLIIVYLFGAYIFFWLIEHYKVTDFWAMVLASVAYPLYVEGIFTGIIGYDTSGVVMLSYFIGWHSVLSVLIGWYIHHKWLVKRETRKLLISSLLIGIFWGLWSVIFWTEQQINDPEMQEFFLLGQWSIIDFGKLVLFFTILYMLAHYLLGFISIPSFKPSRIENVIVIIILGFLMSLQLIANLLALIILMHYLLIILILRRYRGRKLCISPNLQGSASIFQILSGKVNPKHVLPFLIMPLMAILVYGVFYYNRPSDQFIDEFIYNIVVFIQVAYGFVFFILAIIYTLKVKIPLEDHPSNSHDDSVRDL